jgi:beta-mannosidase
VPVRKAAFSSALEIPNPQLWWPNSMGGQPLYTVTATLLDSDKQPLNEDSRQVGLRTIHLQREPDEHGESFRFLVNGKPFFVKGANWIPCDVFPSRTPNSTYPMLSLQALQGGGAACPGVPHVNNAGIEELVAHG